MAETEYYLKKADGSIFGPADLAELRQWAMSGQIAPEDEVSQDKTIWKPAPEVSALDMDWTLQLGDGGGYGPLNLDAIRIFLEDGQIPATTMAVHRTTQETKAVAELLLFAVTAERDALRSRVEKERTSVEEAYTAKLKEAKESILELKKAQNASAKEKQELKQELAEAKAPLKGEGPSPVEVQAVEQKLKQDATRYEKELKEVQAELTRLETALKEKVEVEEALRKQVAETSGASEGQAREVGNLKQALAEAQSAVSARESELEILRAEQASRVGSAVASNAELTATKKQAEALQGRLTQMEQELQASLQDRDKVEVLKGKLGEAAKKIQELEELRNQGAAALETLKAEALQKLETMKAREQELAGRLQKAQSASPPPPVEPLSMEPRKVDISMDAFPEAMVRAANKDREMPDRSVRRRRAIAAQSKTNSLPAKARGAESDQAGSLLRRKGRIQRTSDRRQAEAKNDGAEVSRRALRTETRLQARALRADRAEQAMAAARPDRRSRRS